MKGIGMHIGLIGGIGPAATTIYYARLVEAFRTAQVTLQVTISHSGIETLAENARANDRQAQAKVFQKHLQSLAGAGCDVALVTALTGHFCYDETKALSPIELLNGVELIDRYCEVRGVNCVGILGSPTVMATKIFGMLEKTDSVVPQQDVHRLGQTYMEIANSGVCSEEQRMQFFAAASGLLSTQNADAILLGGTDLGLVFTGYSQGYPVLDAVDIHVEAFLDRAR